MTVEGLGPEFASWLRGLPEQTGPSETRR